MYDKKGVLNLKTIKEIIEAKNPGDIFTGNINTLKKEYRDYVKICHPDANKTKDENISSNAMTNLSYLYEKAKEDIDKGYWFYGNMIKIYGIDKKTYSLNFIKKHNFELGEMYISSSCVMYLVDKKFKQFYNNFIKRISNFKYADSLMKDEFEKYLPTKLSNFETKDGKLGLVIKKTKDVLSLRDILNYYNGNIPDRHVAWILSSLYNLACYLSYNKIVHNNITVDTYFISPLYHSGCLLGGWWYTTQEKEKMIGTTGEVLSVMTKTTKDLKLSDTKTDLESIKLLGRIILGSRSGAKLSEIGVPAPFIAWLRGITNNNAFETYRIWKDKILIESYGERKFVEMKLDENILYKK